MAEALADYLERLKLPHVAEEEKQSHPTSIIDVYPYRRGPCRKT